MSYEKQTWQTGDIVTSAKLNHMEDGIESASSGGGGVLVVNATTTDDASTLDKTWQEIYDAMPLVVVAEATDTGISASLVSSVDHVDGDDYYVGTGSGVFAAASANDYPAKGGK